MAAVTVNSLTHPESRVLDWNPPTIRCGPLALGPVLALHLVHFLVVRLQFSLRPEGHPARLAFVFGQSAFFTSYVQPSSARITSMIVFLPSSYLDVHPIFSRRQGADIIFAVGAVGIVCVVEIYHVIIVFSEVKVEVPAGTINLLVGGPVSEGNEELVIFPLSGSVGLQPCILPVYLEFKVTNPVESLSSPLAGY